MAPYDWNKNGRNDSFDRYMDYQASHSTSNSNQQSSGSSSYHYSNSSNINQDGGIEKTSVFTCINHRLSGWNDFFHLNVNGKQIV